MDRLTGIPKGRLAVLRKHSALAVAIGAAVILPTSSPALADSTQFETAFVATALSEPAPAYVAPIVEEQTYTVIGSGIASYYGRELAGNRTSSGERFDPDGLTAAHRTLPLGSVVRVTNQANGESVVVRINDRGPFHGNRVIDLSQAAASEIGLIRAGRGMVEIALATDNDDTQAAD